MLALKQLFCIFIKYLQATSSFHYTIVHILFNRGIDQKFSASCILLFQQGLDHINCYLLSNGRPTPFQRILNQEITYKKKKRNHLSLERACVEKQMPEPWSIISPSGSSIRISNTSETLSILASLDSCAASFFLIGYSFRWKIDKVLKCENILTRLIQCNLNLVMAVSEKL